MANYGKHPLWADRGEVYGPPEPAMKASWIAVIVLLVLVAIFSAQNAREMSVRFLGWGTTISAAIVIQLAALLGALIGLALGVGLRRRRWERPVERTDDVP